LNVAEGSYRKILARFFILFSVIFVIFFSYLGISNTVRLKYVYKMDFWVILVFICFCGYFYHEWRQVIKRRPIILVLTIIITYGLLILNKTGQYSQIKIGIYLAPNILLFALIRGLIDEYKRKDDGSPLF
jgi:membrane-associated HD superfamily phosphohydrolase